MRSSALPAVALAFVALGGCGRAPGPAPASTHAAAAGAVDAARLAASDRDADQWFTPGRDGGGTYYSPLADIDATNAARLGFAWQYATRTTRGLEATPVVVDGTMYTSGNWGRVYALDAATGRELWTYEPPIDGQYGRAACCDVVNRGVAVWKGKVYVASTDGYLHALDARSGRLLWKADTLPERHPTGFNYFVTGAPVVAGDVIVIGNGGSDFRGARGSVSAYRLDTGAFAWRFYTVPRDPKLGPQDQPHLVEAVKTWPARYDWSNGGGGSAWDGLIYDAATDLVYFGTANGAPYHGQHDRAGEGDELFIASIVAVHAKDGTLAWHYQEIPGEGSDYDTTNKLVLADLTVAGERRAVIMQASKDGYLYVLDRRTGEFLAANTFAYVNWTTGLDPKSHRPIQNPATDWGHSPALMYPAATGAHGWQPMSFDPKTGLVYIPVIEAPMVYVDTTKLRAGLIEGNFDLAFFFPEDYVPADLKSLYGPLPSLESLAHGRPVPKSRGIIRAIDPITGKQAWQTETGSLWDGGVLSTGGDLVFRGDAAGFLNVYSATSGQLLKRIEVGTSIMAAPMTYRVGGVQYVSVMAGYGGALLFLPFPKESAAYRYGNAGRIVTFRLDGGATPAPPLAAAEPPPSPPAREGDAKAIAEGEVLYNRYCGRCHAFGRALLPDLRRLTPEKHAAFFSIVLEGAFRSKGMARWDDVLSRADAGAIHAYLVDQAWQLKATYDGAGAQTP